MIGKASMGEMTASGSWELVSYQLEEVEMVAAPDVAIIAYRVRQRMRIDGGQFHLGPRGDRL